MKNSVNIACRATWTPEKYGGCGGGAPAGWEFGFQVFGVRFQGSMLVVDLKTYLLEIHKS